MLIPMLRIKAGKIDSKRKKKSMQMKNYIIKIFYLRENALMLATKSRSPEFVKKLIDLTDNLNLTDAEGNTVSWLFIIKLNSV